MKRAVGFVCTNLVSALSGSRSGIRAMGARSAPRSILLHLTFLVIATSAAGDNADEFGHATSILRRADQIRFPTEGYIADMEIRSSNSSGDGEEVFSIKVLSSGNDETVVYLPDQVKGMYLPGQGPPQNRKLYTVGEKAYYSWYNQAASQVHLGSGVSGAVNVFDVVRPFFGDGSLAVTSHSQSQEEGHPYHVIVFSRAQQWWLPYERIVYWIEVDTLRPYKLHYNYPPKTCVFKAFKKIAGDERPTRIECRSDDDPPESSVILIKSITPVRLRAEEPGSEQEWFGDSCFISGSVVNIRDRPSASSPAQGKLLYGTGVEIMGKKGDWSRVSVPKKQLRGWLKSELLAGYSCNKPEYPATSDALFSRAAAMVDTDVDSAIKFAERLVVSAPSEKKYLELLARALHKAGRTKAAAAVERRMQGIEEVHVAVCKDGRALVLGSVDELGRVELYPDVFAGDGEGRSYGKLLDHFASRRWYPYGPESYYYGSPSTHDFDGSFPAPFVAPTINEEGGTPFTPGPGQGGSIPVLGPCPFQGAILFSAPMATLLPEQLPSKSVNAVQFALRDFWREQQSLIDARIGGSAESEQSEPRQYYMIQAIRPFQAATFALGALTEKLNDPCEGTSPCNRQTLWGLVDLHSNKPLRGSGRWKASYFADEKFDLFDNTYFGHNIHAPHPKGFVIGVLSLQPDEYCIMVADPSGVKDLACTLIEYHGC